MSLFHDIRSVRAVIVARLRGRKADRWLRENPLVSPAVAGGEIEAIVYFADEPVNLYQMRQWDAPMARLAERHPVAIVARTSVTAQLLRQESSLPVMFLPNIGDVEQWIGSQRVSAVFYVNQNVRNFQMLRHREPAHVFLSHGESEKDYMASNQLKAYDFVFIAGDAARERIAVRLFDYDVEGRTVEIGRPQVDVRYPSPLLPKDDRTVVLYAPTWEGDRPSMTYSSLVSHAPAMVSALTATGRHRVIYRPHPRTGIADAEYADAHALVVATLEQANATDPGANHLVDTDGAFGWHLGAADAAIADISAVAFDWLATGKPLVLTLPASPDAAVDSDGIAGVLIGLDAANAGDIVAALASSDDPEHQMTRAELVRRHFGDVTPGASMGRWLAAASDVIVSRADAIASHPRTSD